MKAAARRVRPTVVRLARWWRWWRLCLGAVVAVGIIGAVVVDRRLFAAMLGLAGISAVLLFITLIGSRVETLHGSVRELRAPGKPSPTALIGPRDRQTTIVVVAAPGDRRVAGLVTSLRTRIAEAPIVIVERSGQEAVRREVARVLVGTTCISLFSSSPSTSIVDDLAAVIEATETLTYIVLHRSVGADDVRDVADLLRHAPGPREPWVGARRLAHRSDLVVFTGASFQEICSSDFTGAGLDDETEALLVDCGFAPDMWPPASQVGEPRLSDSERRPMPVGAGRGCIAMLPQAGYHVAEVAPLATALRRLDLPSAAVISDRWAEDVSRMVVPLGIATYRQPPVGAWIARWSALLTFNDWASDERSIVEAANSYGVPTFGKIEGVQDFFDIDTGRDRRPYQTVRHVLCQGLNDVDAIRALGGTAHIVGSSRLESIWREPPRRAGRPLVVINVNFTFGVLEDAREEFVRSAVAACKRADLDYVLSAHPRDKVRLTDLPVADEPMDQLLRHASVLVSRFSTVPFEAMARGVPFVYHNPHGEQIQTFTKPEGAFETSVDERELAAGLTESLAWVDTYRERAEKFFRRQVDIDPERTAADRSAAAIAEIAAGT